MTQAEVFPFYKRQKRLRYIAFLCLILSSCYSKKPDKSHLFVILDSKPSSLDPRKATDANGMRLAGLIFNGFVKHGDGGELLPDAALNWRLDGLAWTFHLKPDLTFSNGRPVAREDILFSFEEFKKESSPFHFAFKNIRSVEVMPAGSQRSSKAEIKRSSADFKPPFQNSRGRARGKLYQPDLKNHRFKGKKASVESGSETDSFGQHSKSSNPAGGMTVKISMKDFQAPFLYSDLPVIKILPKKEILESPQKFQKKPFGAGDFELMENSYHQILLKRRAEPEAFLPRYISFQIIRDSFTRTQKMLSGESDLAPSVAPLQKIAQFQRQKQNFYVLSRPGLSTTYLLINLRHKLLQNKELRKALSLSINRREIIKHKLYGYAAPAKAFIHPDNGFFNQKLKEPAFDLPQAQSIISALGLSGRELKLSSSNNRDTVNKAQVLASQMSQTGLRISLQSNEWGAFYKDVGQGAYEIALMKWVGALDPDIYRVAFHSENRPPKGRNRSFYTNPKLDKLLDQGFKSRDKAKRKQIYDRIQKIIAEDFIVLPLWHDMEVSIAKANIENYHIRPNGDFLSLPLVKKK